VNGVARRKLTARQSNGAQLCLGNVLPETSLTDKLNYRSLRSHHYQPPGHPFQKHVFTFAGIAAAAVVVPD
jgi:hypothetical protein